MVSQAIPFFYKLVCAFCRYMTAREQKLYERKKQAEELLEWKKRLDTEEAKIYQLERQAMDAWGQTNKDRDRRSKDKDKKGKIPAWLWSDATLGLFFFWLNRSLCESVVSV